MNNHQSVRRDASNNLSFNKAALPISNALLKRLADVLSKQPEVVGENYIVINFRDKN